MTRYPFGTTACLSICAMISGCSAGTHSDGGVTTYTPTIWQLIIWVLVGMLPTTGVLGGVIARWRDKGGSRTVSVIFAVTFLSGLWAMVLLPVIDSCIRDNVTVDSSGFAYVRAEGLFGIERKRFDFEEIRSIETKRSTTRQWGLKGGALTSNYAHLTFRSGRKVSVKVDSLMLSAWPEIVRRASAMRVPVENFA